MQDLFIHFFITSKGDELFSNLNGNIAKTFVIAR